MSVPKRRAASHMAKDRHIRKRNESESLRWIVPFSTLQSAIKVFGSNMKYLRGHWSFLLGLEVDRQQLFPSFRVHKNHLNNLLKMQCLNSHFHPVSTLTFNMMGLQWGQESAFQKHLGDVKPTEVTSASLSSAMCLF